MVCFQTDFAQIQATNDRTESKFGQTRRSKSRHDGSTPAPSAASRSWRSDGVGGVVSGSGSRGGEKGLFLMGLSGEEA